MGFEVVLCVLICLATLGIVIGLVDFHFLISILRVLLILSRLFRATISVFFVPCCPVLLSCYFVLSYMFADRACLDNRPIGRHKAPFISMK